MATALAASPAYVIRAHVGPLPTTLLEVVLVFAIAAGLYAYWPELPWRSPYVWPAALLLVAATVDTVAAPDRRAAAGIWKAYFVEPALAGLVIAAMARARERARLLLLGLAAAGAVVAVANVAVVAETLARDTFDVVRPPVAIYLSPNAVALYLEPLIAFALAIVLLSDDARERAAAGAFTALAGLAVLLSFSRAGWLTLMAVAVFVALFSRWRWLVAGVVVALPAAMFALWDQVRQRVLVEFDLSSPDNTFGLRLTLWRSALDMLLHQPVLGGGLAGFDRSLDPYRDAAYREEHVYPHNVLLNFWSETGLLGLAAFLWLVLQAVRTARRGLAAGPWARAMAVGTLGLLVAVLVHGTVDNPYFKNDQALAFWALLAIQLGSLDAARGERQESA